MNFKTTNKIIVLCLVLSLIFSCQKEEVEPLKTDNNSELETLKNDLGTEIVLGKKLNNPYSVSNMRKAFIELKPSFDSIKLKLLDEKALQWINPEGAGYIDIVNNIGENREVEKDIYNRENWLLKASGDDENWTFTINENDLDLFK